MGGGTALALPRVESKINRSSHTFLSDSLDSFRISSQIVCIACGSRQHKKVFESSKTMIERRAISSGRSLQVPAQGFRPWVTAHKTRRLTLKGVGELFQSSQVAEPTQNPG